MGITIKDIARVAGVSYSTVSKALNNSPLVKEETKVKILALAQELQYQPNLAAKNLVSKRSRIIGIVWPTLERLALSTLVTRITEELEGINYYTVLSINRIESAVALFKRLQVDGILVFEESRLSGETMLFSSKIPILTFTDRESSRPHLNANRKQAIRKAVHYLNGMGHRNITYVGEIDTPYGTQYEKLKGYTEAMKELKLPLRPEFQVHIDEPVWLEGYRAARLLLQSTDKPTAVISSSYETTLGMMLAFKESQISIPEDLSLISYDNIPQLANLDISITAVGIPVDTIAKNIVQSIIQLIENPENSLTSNAMEAVIFERESCSPPKDTTE